ncbi:efflux RND transporter periplasmic adaptor subunit [Opitutus sp. ER46]|uniref:efflux RND transporter periplasmic adaptor subunit n=1 Tax=Opitutus sp. ER46 TaxID=2161864 RepID=UPI000D305FA9|nr:efflux RND transporter periplasmic adaptor subunit [Opitutus sp. ER46]PTX94556.1 efflux RND transporter periplasmic adaptor subunit [Opitutus sp. ER46]
MAKSRNYGGLIVIAALLVAAAGGAWYYLAGKNDKQPEFSTTKVGRGDITQAVTATGDLQPVVTVDVGAQVSGQVKEVLVDFNSRVKAGDVLARIDPAMAEQKLRQAQADLESAKANNQLLQINARRTRDLAAKNLVSQSELDTAEAQLAQSNATLMTRTAAVENAKLDLLHCTITAPIDGMVLNRNTDRGRTVNSSMNAPTLFTLVNDLTRMQIQAAVAEADVGAITEGMDVTFTVDAFPNRTFRGTVRQVRNAATTTSSVVSYATIIDVNNDDLRLKPGMTANVSIIIAQKTNALRISNSALRARIPQELLPKAPEPAKTAKAGAAPAAAPAMNDQERFAIVRAIWTELGIQRGTPPSAEQIAAFRAKAAEKGLDAETIDRVLTRFSGGGPGGRRSREGGAPGAPNPVVTRTVYKLVDPVAQKLEPVNAKLGISDGMYTEVLDGLAEDDTLVTAVTLPGTTAATQPAQNPFQQNRGFGPGMGGGRR